MPRSPFALALIALTLSATAADAWTRIRTEAEFRAQVVGRQTWIDGRGGTLSHPDGRVTGEWDGQRITGRWVWDNGAYCRNLRLGQTETGTDCQHYFIRGNQVRALSERGRGRETIAAFR